MAHPPELGKLIFHESRALLHIVLHCSIYFLHSRQVIELTTYLKERRDLVDRFLDLHLPPERERPSTLHEAMRYSTLAGGKRVRPTLCIAAAEAVGGSVDEVMHSAGALEILHTYTLIHDDLPCMDDDDLRRSIPTCHVKFGEDIAVLAGDALLTLAFEWIAAAPAPSPYPPTQLVLELAQAAGHQGVIAGQVEDLAGEGSLLDEDDLQFIHIHKTAMLIRGAVRIGCIEAGGKPTELDALTRYGADIGLAFQIADDVLNATSDEMTLGKPVGSDDQRGKNTYVRIHGIPKAREMANALVENAIKKLDGLSGDPDPLAAIARFIIARDT